jgi:hypothetical protein
LLIRIGRRSFDILNRDPGIRLLKCGVSSLERANRAFPGPDFQVGLQIGVLSCDRGQARTQSEGAGNHWRRHTGHGRSPDQLAARKFQP